MKGSVLLRAAASAAAAFAGVASAAGGTCVRKRIIIDTDFYNFVSNSTLPYLLVNTVANCFYRGGKKVGRSECHWHRERVHDLGGD